MRLLLDTQALLWFLTNDRQLSAPAKAAIESQVNDLFVSVVSLWEIVIKVSLQKLRLPAPFGDVFPTQLQQNGFALLPIEIRDLLELEALPFHHRDPFDRLLIAQAKAQGLVVATSDHSFAAYAIPIIW